jgi:4-hydroxy-4-methyl-2-oxoglutarate aldolase
LGLLTAASLSGSLINKQKEPFIMQQNKKNNPYEIVKQYKYLRVVDVVDGLDGIGYFNVGLVDRKIRPLWEGMRFWGVAVTVRCVPSNKPMWKLKNTKQIVDAHSIWFKAIKAVPYEYAIRPGCVLVMDAGSSGEVGFFGSNNGMGTILQGAVGIVTNGYCRDTGEVTLQKTPICCRARGRTIIPGRIEVADVQTRIGLGGAQVCPGDIIGCDDDGIVVVPQTVAREVAIHARAVLLADMHGRSGLYQRLGKTPDETVDFKTVEQYYRELK